MMKIAIWLSCLYLLCLSKYEYVGFKEYPSRIQSIVSVDDQNTILQFNDAFNNIKLDSTLPLFSIHFGNFHNLNSLYYMSNDILYEWQEKQKCDIPYEEQPIAFLVGERYTFLLNKNDPNFNLSLLVVDQECRAANYSLDISLQSPFIKMQNINNQLLLIVTQDKLVILQKVSRNIRQIIVPKRQFIEDYLFNVTIDAGNITFILYSGSYYEIYRCLTGNLFQFVVGNSMAKDYNFLDFTEKNGTNFLDKQCRVYNVNLQSQTVIQPQTKIILGKPVGYLLDLSIFVRPDGIILQLDIILKQFVILSQIPLNAGISIHSATILSNKTVYFTTSQRIFYSYDIISQSKVKIIDNIDFNLKQSIDYYQTQYMVSCSDKICKFYQFDGTNYKDEGNVDINSSTNVVDAFVQDNNYNYNYATLYFLIFKNQLNEYETFVLNRTSAGNWRLIGQRILPEYKFSYNQVAKRNYTVLITSQTLQNGTTIIKQYSASNLTPNIYTYQNLYTLGANFLPRKLFIYRNNFIKTASSSFYPSGLTDYIEDINKSTNIFLLNQDTVYFQVDNVGKIARIANSNMRIQNQPVVIPRDFCLSNSTPIFRLVNSFFQPSVFVRMASDSKLIVVGRTDNTKDFTQRYIDISYNHSKITVTRSLRYQRQSDEIYFAIEYQNTHHLLYQSLANFLYQPNFSWKYRYSHSQIDKYAVSYSNIGIQNQNQGKITTYIKNSGRSKALKLNKYYASQISSKNIYYMLLELNGNVVSKSHKINFLTNATMYTIPYQQDWDDYNVQMSPSGDFVFFKSVLYKGIDRIGYINFTTIPYFYWIDDHSLFYSDCSSTSSQSNCDLRIYTLKEHPFNYSYVSVNITSMNSRSIATYFNQTHVFYTANNKLYILDSRLRTVQSMSLDVVGQIPQYIYGASSGDVYVSWNTVLHRWRPGKQGGGDDGGAGAPIGLIVGSIAGGVGAVIASAFIIKKIRNKMQKKVSSTNLITSEQVSENSEKF